MSWQYFPKRVWLTGFKPAPFVLLSNETTAWPMGDVSEVRVNVDARPDGTFSGFPDGAFLQLFSLEATIASGGGVSSYNETPWDAIDLNSLSWTYQSGSNSYQSGIVKTFKPWGDVTVGSGESMAGKVMTIDVRVEPSDAIDQVALTSGWMQIPRGYAPAANTSFLSSVHRKGVEIAGIHADFENTGIWYRSCTVTDSTDAAYVVGSSFDPLSRPAGFKLTGQTATTRTWSKSDTDHFTITLSDAWVYDSTAFDGKSHDFGNFVISGPPEITWKAIDTFLQSYEGNIITDQALWPDDIGSIKYMIWAEGAGYSSKTCSSSKVLPWSDIYTYLTWKTGDFSDSEYPIIAISKTGALLKGLIYGKLLDYDSEHDVAYDTPILAGSTIYAIGIGNIGTSIPALT